MDPAVLQSAEGQGMRRRYQATEYNQIFSWFKDVPPRLQRKVDGYRVHSCLYERSGTTIPFVSLRASKTCWKISSDSKSDLMVHQFSLASSRPHTFSTDERSLFHWKFSWRFLKTISPSPNLGHHLPTFESDFMNLEHHIGTFQFVNKYLSHRLSKNVHP